jgi:N-terminal domain of anti-restriction factor ArdC
VVGPGHPASCHRSRARSAPDFRTRAGCGGVGPWARTRRAPLYRRPRWPAEHLPVPVSPTGSAPNAATQDRERLQRSTEQLLSSAGSQRWVRVRSRTGLARLSLGNQLLVAMACPDATFIARYRAWIDLGYQVRKGEHGIPITAPMPINHKTDPRAEDDRLVLFRTVFVFDCSQVDPIDEWNDQRQHTCASANRPVREQRPSMGTATSAASICCSAWFRARVGWHGLSSTLRLGWRGAQAGGRSRGDGRVR